MTVEEVCSIKMAWESRSSLSTSEIRTIASTIGLPGKRASSIETLRVPVSTGKMVSSLPLYL